MFTEFDVNGPLTSISRDFDCKRGFQSISVEIDPKTRLGSVSLFSNFLFFSLFFLRLCVLVLPEAVVAIPEIRKEERLKVFDLVGA